MKTMRFLVNPRGKPASEPAPRKRRKRKAPARAHPGAAAKHSTTTAKKMAKSKRKRRRVTRRNPAPAARRVTTRRRTFRRNPAGFRASSIVPMLLQGAKDAAGVVVGKAGARLARSRLGYESGTVVGSAVEVAVGVVGGMLAAKVSPAFGRMVTAGALAGTLEAVVKSANVPFISSALGDAGDLAELGNHPAYYEQVAGYPMDALGPGVAGYPVAMGDAAAAGYE